MKNIKSDNRLRLSGMALDLALDPLTNQYSIDRLNERIAEMQSDEPSGSVGAEVGQLRKEISGLTHMMDLQHHALMLIFANKGHESDKALGMLGRATDALLKARKTPTQTGKGSLTGLIDQMRQREIEEQREHDIRASEETSQQPKQPTREMGS